MYTAQRTQAQMKTTTEFVSLFSIPNPFQFFFFFVSFTLFFVLFIASLRQTISHERKIKYRLKLVEIGRNCDAKQNNIKSHNKKQ